MMCDHNFAAASADHDVDKNVDDSDTDDDGKLNSQTTFHDSICIFCVYDECDCQKQEND